MRDPKFRASRGFLSRFLISDTYTHTRTRVRTRERLIAVAPSRLNRRKSEKKRGAGEKETDCESSQQAVSSFLPVPFTPTVSFVQDLDFLVFSYVPFKISKIKWPKYDKNPKKSKKRLTKLPKYASIITLKEAE